MTEPVAGVRAARRAQWVRAGIAIVIELVLGTIALQGGPHGSVGPWSWAMQLPGILILFAPPPDRWMAFRLVLVFVVQACLWFAVLTVLARARDRRRRA